MDIKPIVENTCQQVSCNTDSLEKEYGSGSTGTAYCIENNTFETKDFNQWQTIINLNTCKIEENQNISSNAFFYAIYAQNIYSEDPALYSNIISCTQNTHGIAKTCGLTTKISDVANAPIVTILSAIPENQIKPITQQLKNGGWTQTEIGVAEGSIKFSKNIGNVSIYLDIAKNISCPFAQTRQEAFFELANNINQTYSDTKNFVFQNNTFSQINATNQTLLELANLKADLGQGFIETVAGIGQPQLCNFDPIRNQIQSFQDKTTNTSIEASQLEENFQQKLNQLKTAADNTLVTLEKAQKENQPKIQDWIIVPTKAIKYEAMVFQSKAENDYQNQLYVSSITDAQNEMKNLSLYWTTPSPIHVTLSIIGYGLIILLISISILTYKKGNKGDSNTPNSEII